MEDKLKEIINGEFINIVYQGEIYLLVDEIFYNDKLITYFNSLNNELFCYKKDDYYEIINDDELIDEVKEKNNLYIDEYMYFGKFKNNLSISFEGETVDKKYRYMMIVNFMNYLSKIASFDKNKVRGILDKVNFIKVEGFNGHDIGACYHVPSNSLYFRNGLSNRVMFHDMLHALIGKRSIGHEILIGQGLNEGAVELTTIRVFNKDVSSTYCGKTFNYDTTNHSYIEESCIVNQLEYIMNRSINDFVIDGNDSIFKEFYQKYGLNTYIKFRFLLNKLTKCHNNNQYEEVAKYFSEIQDFLLEKVFNVEFNNIYDLDSAREYFKSLNAFGYYRGKEDVIDSKLKAYFDSKRDLCSKKLNIDLSDINYVPVKFKDKYLMEDFDSRITIDAFSYLHTHKHNKAALYKLIKDSKVYGILFCDDELVLCKEYDLNSSKKVNNLEFNDSDLILLNDFSKLKVR